MTRFCTVRKLEELRDYMKHKEETMERIKDLEESLESERATYERKIKEFEDQMKLETEK